MSQVCQMSSNFPGRSAAGPSKIVNGSVASSQSWPWLTRMTFHRGFSAFLCGGSIIDDNWIITAAHCCDNTDSVDIHIGDQNRFGKDKGEFTISSSQIFKHPLYQSGNGFDWDVCLVKTQSLR